MSAGDAVSRSLSHEALHCAAEPQPRPAPVVPALRSRSRAARCSGSIADRRDEGFRRAPVSVVRDFETKGGLNQERVWRIMVDVTRLVCGEATDGFGWSCV